MCQLLGPLQYLRCCGTACGLWQQAWPWQWVALKHLIAYLWGHQTLKLHNVWFVNGIGPLTGNVDSDGRASKRVTGAMLLTRWLGSAITQPCADHDPSVSKRRPTTARERAHGLGGRRQGGNLPSSPPWRLPPRPSCEVLCLGLPWSPHGEVEACVTLPATRGDSPARIERGN